MSTAAFRGAIATPITVAVAALVVLILVYGVLSAQILLSITGVLAMASLGLALYLVHLFHRLVVAVERIAADG